MTLETDLTEATNELRVFRDEVATKHMQKMQELTDGEAARNAQVASSLADMRREMPIGRTYSYNHDFRDLVDVTHDGTTYQVPKSMGLNAGGFFDRYDIEIIPVQSGVDPTTRHPIAIELLNAMQSGNPQYFSAFFNILHIKRKFGSPAPEGWIFHPPNQHVKTGVGQSFIFWARTNAEWNFAGDTGEQWKVCRYVWPAQQVGGGSAITYANMDFYTDPTGTEEIYLALPSIVDGVWPENRILGILHPSVQTEIDRKLAV